MGGTIEVESNQAVVNGACSGSIGNCPQYAAQCKLTSTTEGTDDETDGGEITTTGGVSTLTCKLASSILGSDGTTAQLIDRNIHYDQQVIVRCNGVNLGKYTVASTDSATPATQTITFQETVPDCNSDYVTVAAGGTTTINARNADVTLEYAGWVLKTDVDLMSVQSLLTGKSIS